MRIVGLRLAEPRSGVLPFRLLILIPLCLLLRFLSAMFPPMGSPAARQRQRELMAEKMAWDANHR